MVSFIAYLKILDLMIDYDSILDYIKAKYSKIKYKNLENAFFKGYKILLSLTWNKLIYYLEMSDIIQLDTDKFYERIFHYVDLKIEEKPVTCDKTAFIIGLYNLSNKIRIATGFLQILEGIKEIKPFLDVLRDYLNSSLTFDSVSVDRGINLLTIYALYNDFHNCEPREPHLFINNIVPFLYSYKEIFSSLFGYLTIVEFLWSNLISPTDLTRSKIDKLSIMIPHFKILEDNIINIGKFFRWNKYLSELRDQKDIVLNNVKLKTFCKKIRVFYNKYGKKIAQIKAILTRIDKELEKNKILERRSIFSWRKIGKSTKILTGRTNDFYSAIVERFWIIFDSFFNIIRPYIRNIEEDFPFDFKMFERILFSKNINKSDVEQYLAPINPPELSKDEKDQDIIFKILDRKLYWYKLEALALVGQTYRGFSLVRSLLLGEISLAKKYPLKKVYFKSFKHKNDKSMSYGILMEMHGSFGSDYSGWLIFYNVSTYGYSGDGPQLTAWISEIVNNNRTFLNWEEIQIDSNIFIQYLKEKTTPDYFHEDDSKKSRIQGVIGTLQGKYFEALIYKWLISSKLYNKVIWGKIINKNEIDNYGIIEYKKEIDLYECKIAIHFDDIESIVKNIIRKKSVLENKYNGYNVNSYVIVYSFISQAFKKPFLKDNIKIKDNFRNEIQNNTNLFGKFKHIQDSIEFYYY